MATLASISEAPSPASGATPRSVASGHTTSPAHHNTATAPAVSVCIVNRDCANLLRDCLHSLAPERQGMTAQVIVIDNASTDGAAAMVAREFPWVLLIRSPRHLGFSRANNLAASLAAGRYLFFLNNDTVVPPGTLRRLADYADRHPEVGIVAPRLRDADGRVQVSWRARPTVATFLNRTCLVRWTGLLRRRYRRYRRDAFDPDTIRSVEVLMGAALFMRRQTFLACGRWDEDFTFGGEDLELCLRVGRRYPLVYYPHAEVTHHGRASTRCHPEYASPHIAVGFARYLRKAGARGWRLAAYKLAVTLDAPLELAGKGLKGLAQLLVGRHQQGRRNLLAARGAWYFLRRGVVGLWSV